MSSAISLLGLKHPFDYEIVDSSGMAQLIIPLVYPYQIILL